MKNLLKDKVAPQGADYTVVVYNSTVGSVSVKAAPPKPIPTRWYSGNTLIKEIDIVGELSSTYKETACTKCEIGENVTSIGDNAFSTCIILSSITIPDSVTSIGENAFGGCSSLTSVTVDPNNTVYHSDGNCCMKGSKVVFGCKTSIIPTTATSIGNFAFRNCSGLTSVTIPNSVTTIGDFAFSSCSGLTSIDIPNSVTKIGSYAFGYCTKLTSVTYNGTKSQWNAITKGTSWKTEVPSSCKVHCTDGDIAI